MQHDGGEGLIKYQSLWREYEPSAFMKHQRIAGGFTLGTWSNAPYFTDADFFSWSDPIQFYLDGTEQTLTRVITVKSSNQIVSDNTVNTTANDYNITYTYNSGQADEQATSIDFKRRLPITISGQYDVENAKPLYSRSRTLMNLHAKGLPSLLPNTVLETFYVIDSFNSQVVSFTMNENSNLIFQSGDTGITIIPKTNTPTGNIVVTLNANTQWGSINLQTRLDFTFVINPLYELTLLGDNPKTHNLSSDGLSFADPGYQLRKYELAPLIGYYGVSYVDTTDSVMEISAIPNPLTIGSFDRLYKVQSPNAASYSLEPYFTALQKTRVINIIDQPFIATPSLTKNPPDVWAVVVSTPQTIDLSSIFTGAVTYEIVGTAHIGALISSASISSASITITPITGITGQTTITIKAKTTTVGTFLTYTFDLDVRNLITIDSNVINKTVVLLSPWTGSVIDLTTLFTFSQPLTFSYEERLNNKVALASSATTKIIDDINISALDILSYKTLTPGTAVLRIFAAHDTAFTVFKDISIEVTNPDFALEGTYQDGSKTSQTVYFTQNQYPQFPHTLILNNLMNMLLTRTDSSGVHNPSTAGNHPAWTMSSTYTATLISGAVPATWSTIAGAFEIDYEYEFTNSFTSFFKKITIEAEASSSPPLVNAASMAPIIDAYGTLEAGTFGYRSDAEYAAGTPGTPTANYDATIKFDKYAITGGPDEITATNYDFNQNADRVVQEGYLPITDGGVLAKGIYYISQWHSHKLSGTSTPPWPYVVIDLLFTYSIEYIEVYRTDVYNTDNPADTSYYGLWRANPLTFHLYSAWTDNTVNTAVSTGNVITDPTPAEHELQWDLPLPINARFVKIEIAENDYAHIGKVKVMGRRV